MRLQDSQAQGDSMAILPVSQVKIYEWQLEDLKRILILKYGLDERTQFSFKNGHTCDLSDFEGRVYIPSSRNFLQIKFLNLASSRRVCVFMCLENHGHCRKVFRKWHNLFDHLRIHTGERPYDCPVQGCHFAFNQISNQNKHIDVHRN